MLHPENCLPVLDPHSLSCPLRPLVPAGRLPRLGSPHQSFVSRSPSPNTPTHTHTHTHTHTTTRQSLSPSCCQTLSSRSFTSTRTKCSAPTGTSPSSSSPRRSGGRRFSNTWITRIRQSRCGTGTLQTSSTLACFPRASTSRRKRSMWRSRGCAAAKPRSQTFWAPPQAPSAAPVPPTQRYLCRKRRGARCRRR